MKYANSLIAVLIVPSILFLYSCSTAAPAPVPDESEPPIPVTLGTPTSDESSDINASGQVEATQTATIGTRIMGAITHVYVRLGDKVARGQLLATIASQDIDARQSQADAQIAAASASLDNAKKDFDRYSRLYAQQSATASELDNVTLRYRSAQADLKTARERRAEADATMAYTRLTAPFAGTITAKTLDEGSLASPGMPLFTLEQSGPLQVSISVPESDIWRIRPGAVATVTIPAVNRTEPGVVAQVNPSSAGTGGQYIVKISLSADARQGLLPGMFVHVSMTGTATGVAGRNVETPAKTPAIAVAAPGSKRVLIPLSALVHNDQLAGIYTVSNAHTALLRWVRTGKTDGDRIEVLSGLAADEPFIVRAAGRLYNGAPVRPQ